MFLIKQDGNLIEHLLFGIISSLMPLEKYFW